jgi:hypothetical protein
MSKTLFYAARIHSDDAGFRAWAKPIADFLKTFLTQTADTGQVADWTTVTRPAAGAWVNEIYRFNDSLHATAPFYIRIEYGTLAAGATYPSLRATIGQTVNGAGVLGGGTTNTVELFTSGIAPNATVRPCFVSGGPDRLTIGMWLDEGQNAVAGLSISRTRGADGVATNGGVNMTWQAANARGQQFMGVGLTKFPTTPLTHLLAPIPVGANKSMSYGGSVGVGPILPFRGYADYPDLGMVIYSTSDVVGPQIFPATLLGAQHIYYALGDIGGNNPMTNVSGIGLRYE